MEPNLKPTLSARRKSPTKSASYTSKPGNTMREIRERLAKAINTPSLPPMARPVMTLPIAEPKAPKTRKIKRWNFETVDGYMFQKPNASKFSKVQQESILIYELIYSLTGVPCTYIVPEKRVNIYEVEEQPFDVASYKFKISDQIHSALHPIAADILPMITHYICVQNFIEEVNLMTYSQVHQALGSALNSYMQEYYLMLSQLESLQDAGDMSLHRLVIALRPTGVVIETFADILSEASKNRLNAGQLLTLLCERVESLPAKEDAQEAVINLLDAAVVPFMQNLQLWLGKGIVKDPKHEFLIEDSDIKKTSWTSLNPEHYSADYWLKRYTVVEERVPCFLTDVTHQILCAGKYLNVVRQCGKRISGHIKPEQFIFSLTNREYLVAIKKAYTSSAKKLLIVLLKDNNLLGHLQTVKRYLLMQQGDFIEQFLSSCEAELALNIDQVVPTRLENLMALVMRVSSSTNDPYKDNVHCELIAYDLVTQLSRIIEHDEPMSDLHTELNLTGLEAFAFRYDAKWPISLVLNHISLTKLQMIFRELFFLKYVEKQLRKTWGINSGLTHTPHSHTLRQRMFTVIQHIEYYLTMEVIEPSWRYFMSKITKVENIDEVLDLWQDFLDNCLRNCMLTESVTIIRSIFTLGKICLSFCEYIVSPDPRLSRGKFTSDIKAYENEFTELIGGILKFIDEMIARNPGDRIRGLADRLNFNSFNVDN